MNIVRIESDEEIFSTREVSPDVRPMMESEGYRPAAASALPLVASELSSMGD